MKLKVIGIFVVVLIAQTQFVQGSPIVLNQDLLGEIVNLATGAITTLANTLPDALLLFSDTFNGVVEAIEKIAKQVSVDVNSAIGAVEQIAANAGISTSNITNDPVAAGNAYLSFAAGQISPIIENTLTPLSYFNFVVNYLIEDTIVLLSNPIGKIRQTIGDLSSAINSVDLFQSGIDITYQGAGLVGNILEPVAVPIAMAIDKIASSIPIAVDSGLNTLTAELLNIDNVLNDASKLINVLGAQVATGNLGLLDSVVPIRRALRIPVNNIANTVSSVPAKISDAITAMHNAAKTYIEVSNVRRKEISDSIASVGTVCANDVATNIDVASNAALEEAVFCISNETVTLQDYLAKYQKNAEQYQNGILNNTLSIASLKQTVQISSSFLLYLISAELKVDGCLARHLLSFSGDLLPLAAYGVTCTA